MSNLVRLENLFHHRTRQRIKDLGEVFTPESYVEDMLDLLAKDKRGLWSDETVSFFEPCSGHGNIVLPIYRRRLEGFYKKAIEQSLTAKPSDAPYFAVANALNTLWAIDIDSKNVENCRSRVLDATLDFLKTKLGINNDLLLLSKKKDFFSHLLTAIKWHIDENETLSSLSKASEALANANLTKSGSKWFAKNGHEELDFDLTWAVFFESCKANNTIPLEYERSSRFIEAIVAGKRSGYEDFEFAKSVIGISKTSELGHRTSRSISAGA